MTTVIHTNASFDLIAFQVQTDRTRGSGVRECLEIETSLFDESSEEIEKVTCQSVCTIPEAKKDLARINKWPLW